MLIQIKAPNDYSEYGHAFKIFLAGSIEMGSAVNWQSEVVNELGDLNVVILNPRRDDWDSSWIQTIENEWFRTQVEWELGAMDDADVILMNFVGNTQSPITLLEFGLYAASGKLIVSCDRDFWRRGNVEVVCHKYNIPLLDNIGDLVSSMKRHMHNVCRDLGVRWSKMEEGQLSDDWVASMHQINEHFASKQLSSNTQSFTDAQRAVLGNGES